MRRWSVMFAGLLALVLVSCGGASKRKTTTNKSKLSPTATPQEQLRQLVAQHNTMRRQLGMGSMGMEGDAGTDAKRPTANGTSPKPDHVASTCDDVCRITTSICDNAARICKIAKDKLPDDEWAQKKCKEATTSCTEARGRCTKCKAR